jgi:dihydroorotate dehydrogenase/Pyruvate/2-oxoacid:ferredoxin oxidoreductase delta subunit
MQTTFLGYTIRSQIIAASCPATESQENVDRCISGGAGAVILKTASSTRLDPATQGGRKCVVDDDFFWAKSSFNREIMSLAKNVELVRSLASKVEAPVIASITELDLDVEKWLASCAAVEEAGANAIQLDLFYMENLLSMPNFQEKFIKLIKEILSHSRVPVMPKLNIGLPAEYAAFLLREAGVKHVSLLDSIKSPPPFEAETGSFPRVNQDLLGPGLSVFGRFMLPLSRQYTWIISNAGFEVCAGGGVTTGADAVDLIFLGASTVQIATEALLRGFGRFREIEEETDMILHKAGIVEIQELKQMAAKLYHPSAMPDARTEARWHRQECHNCLHCAPANQGFCAHIHEQLDNDLRYIYISGCEGCELCAKLCSFGAIKMIPKR